MQRFSYKLKTFIRAIETIAKRKGYSRVEYETKRGSGIRFEFFIPKEEIPTCFLVIHTEHEAAKRLTSRQDYKKAAVLLDVSLEELVEVLEEER